jgi:hypothetical protein
LTPGPSLGSLDWSALTDTMSCDRSPLENAALRSLRGESDIVFVLPVGSQGRLAGTVSVDEAGSLDIAAEFLELPAGGLARLMLPDLGTSGRRHLSDAAALVSGRFRPEGGLDLASLVPSGSQGDQMFRLKSAIFQGAALSGAWEFALYPPAKGKSMPLLALSADVRFRGAALAGMRQFVADLEATWPIYHRSVRFGIYTGACFDDLRIMPEFAPCYADTPEAMIVGWNPEAVRLALSSARAEDAEGATAAGQSDPGDHAAELVVRFGDLSAADDRLREGLAPDAIPRKLDYFWDRLAVVSGRRESPKGSLGSGSGSDSGSVWLRARLRAAGIEASADTAGDAS